MTERFAASAQGRNTQRLLAKQNFQEAAALRQGDTAGLGHTSKLRLFLVIQHDRLRQLLLQLGDLLPQLGPFGLQTLELLPCLDTFQGARDLGRLAIHPLPTNALLASKATDGAIAAQIYHKGAANPAVAGYHAHG